MSVKLVDQFVYNNTLYKQYYDSGNDTCSSVVSGNNPQSQINFPNSENSSVPDQVMNTFCSDNPATTRVEIKRQTTTPFIYSVLTPNASECTIGPTPGCDLVINSVNPTAETEQDANDGAVTINASTSKTGLVFSVDGINYQSGNLFTDLAPGNYTAYAKDSGDCVDTEIFTILAYNNPVQNFSDGLPIVDIGGGNISKWNAAFNPIVVTYQRKDFAVTSVVQGNDVNHVKVQVSTTLPLDQYDPAITKGVTFQTALYSFAGLAESYSPGDGFVIKTPYLGYDTVGWLNIPSLKSNFYIQTELTTGDNPVFKNTILAEHSPNYKGQTKADLSPYLQTLLSPNETYDYLAVSYKDTNLGGSFTLRYRERWDNGTGSWFSAPYPLYYTYAAKQLGERYGGNMAEYVPFMTVSQPQRPKFLTDFEVPSKWEGLPFDLQFIYSENIINRQVSVEITPDCGAMQSGLLLNADAGYILNADLSKFIIERTYDPNIQGYPIIEALGVNRVLIPNVFDCCATKLVTNIYYTQPFEPFNKVYVMQDLTIKHECACDDPYVYLKWINSRGGWDYWRFGYNQVLSQTTGGSEQVSYFVDNYESDQTIEDYISRQANRKISLVAGNLDMQQLRALRWMSNSRRVQMLVSLNPIKWHTVIIPDGDFVAGETRKGFGNVKLSITLPSVNIQHG